MKHDENCEANGCRCKQCPCSELPGCEGKVIDAAPIFDAVRELNKIRQVRESLDAVILEAVKRAREDDTDWDDIGKALGIGGGQAYVLYAHLIKESCGNCWKCTQFLRTSLYSTGMILCEICGNKRCPHATDHELDCTGSNEPGQKGSAYE